MTVIHVVGIGLDGADGLTDSVQTLIQQSSWLVGSQRHLGYFPDFKGDRLVLGDLAEAIQTLEHIARPPALQEAQAQAANSAHITILASGDPLFFGLGRLLLAHFPAEQLVFHPHLSSVQLAFSRIKVPWQDARFISAHGRSLDRLIQALQQGCEKIAVLTDGINTPAAIAQLLRGLDLPSQYQIWVCENLGGHDEQIRCFDPAALIGQSFAALNVVVLLQVASGSELALEQLPQLGIPDACFLSFDDRPGLMTKREIRLLVLGELALQPQQVVWDIGAGTGSVSIEIARLCPDSQIYAIEQTAAGAALIQQNRDRFRVKLHVVQGIAPAALPSLPHPDRIFIGGSGGRLTEILQTCSQRLNPGGVMVVALATLEHLTEAQTWLQQQQLRWRPRWLQAQMARSVPIAALTRFSPLNPVTLLTLEQSPNAEPG